MQTGTRLVSIRVCDNCGGSGRVPYGSCDATDAVHRIQIRCTDCGLVYTDPRLAPEALTDLYRGYHTAHEIIEAEEQVRRARAVELLAELEALVSPGKLVDLGSGSGTMLTVAAARGWQVRGVELSEAGVQHARSRYGLNVSQGMVEDAQLEPGWADAVLAWHVIEHVFDLDAFVRGAHRLLRPGGMLLVGTEAYDTPANTAFRVGRRLRRLEPRAATSSEHTFVFTAASLTDVLRRRGFEPVHVTAYDELSLRDRIRATGAGTRVRRVGAAATAVAGRLGERILGRGPYLRGFFVRS